MPGLRLRRWRRDDRGGVAVIVAVLLGSGVLLGVAALSIDVGQLHAERRELQNGADAAAFAVAQGCMQGATTCDSATAQGGTAAKYADANADDGFASVQTVCGNGSSLPVCPTAATNLTACHALPTTLPAGVKYVEVRTQTLTDKGRTLLPPTFAGALAGNSGYQGSAVGACSRVAWGPAANVPSIAVTLSSCEWTTTTNDGNKLAPAPPYASSPWPPTGLKDYQTTIYLKSKQEIGTGTCAHGPSGFDAAGAFGWLDDTGGSCGTTITGTTYSANPGNAGGSCTPELEKLVAAGKAGKPVVIFVPVYGGVDKTGNNTTYTLKGFAAFVVTGFHVPSETQNSWLTDTPPCQQPDTCISGYFTQKLVPTGTVGSTADLGVEAMQLAG